MTYSKKFQGDWKQRNAKEEEDFIINWYELKNLLVDILEELKKLNEKV